MDRWSNGTVLLFVVNLWVQSSWVFSQPQALADGAVLLSGLGAGGSGYWLNGGSQGAEEAGDEGEAKASPCAEHGPAIAMANVIRQAVQVPRETGKLKVDASNTGTQGDDAEGSWNDRVRYWEGENTSKLCHSERLLWCQVTSCQYPTLFPTKCVYILLI